MEYDPGVNNEELELRPDDRPSMWGWLASGSTSLQEQAQPSLKRGNSPYKSPGTKEPSKNNLSSEAKRVLTKRLFDDSVDHTATPVEAPPSIPHDVSPDDEQHTTVSAGPTPASADGPPFGAVDTEDLDGDIEYTDGDIFLSIAKSAENNVCVANLLSSHDPSSLSSLGILQGLSDLGFGGFRSPYQEAAVISVTEGIKATSVRLPTGGGKSLTFLLPSWVNYKRLRDSGQLANPNCDPFVLVLICPLIALTREQASAMLIRTGLDETSIVAIDGDTTTLARERLCLRLRERDPGLFALVLCPEMLVSHPEIQADISTSRPFIIGIDELHTVHQWMFYCAMLRLPSVVQQLAKTMESKRIVFLTATLDDGPLKTVVQKFGLSMDQLNDISAPRVRPNVHLEARYINSPVARDVRELVARWVRNKHSGDMVVVYLSTPKEVNSLYRGLVKLDFSCGYIHGKMNHNQRKWMLNLIQRGAFQIVIATIAYGLGIDQNFKGVYILGGAGSVEAGVQLSGRAGRDLGKADVTFALSAQIMFKAYSLYAGNYEQMEKYNHYLLTIFDASTCLQKSLGLWDTNICGSCTCQMRCDVCCGDIAIYKVDIAGAARALVGDGGVNSSGLLGDLVSSDGVGPNFQDVITAWALSRSSAKKELDNPDLPPSLLPVVLLLVCAHEFIEPRLIEGAYNSTLRLYMVPPGLVKRLFPEVQRVYSVRGPRYLK
mmetsp:Transcript_68670/g.138081  ORF Transcript_68670/g.138081 Transcript_68670/m.138081 type:complete len:717 (-) Transcript_68670:228-2378(-)|eukprot:CAMPEP_0171733544 /NCGR_PEP_ID=MMETSP0991-20121206/30346_1 /TAXON_ID=483369 /ORGANISM="non described non described, Strain CCMP2098" /LENGTH=716 /DNA_ID=CAMNT_0012329281 /DNA_START=275 /DNA_END=2425 /DNA_ORIENTATION=+